MASNMKLNGWAQMIILILGMMGLVSWIITADSRLHNRCDKMDTKLEKQIDNESQHYVEMVELKGDVKLIRQILEERFPQTAEKVKRDNGYKTNH
jgi:hypothetical protein